jgi:arylsulfatase A-like enzyme
MFAKKSLILFAMAMAGAFAPSVSAADKPHRQASSSAETKADRQGRPNVLLIMCDDLNDYVSGFDGHPQAKTPAVEKLAASGTLFSRAYCNFPACVPSRNSLIHGLYPHHTSSSWQPWTKLPAFKGNKTMMTYFRENGYTVIGSGKVDHYYNPKEWSTFYNKADYGPFWHAKGEAVAHPDVKAPFCEIGRVDGSFGSLESALKHGPAAGDGWHYAPPKWKAKAKPMTKDPKLGWMTPDKKNAQLMKNLLTGKTAGLKEPFFLGVGFIRPHTPLHVEENYFKQFPMDKLKLNPIKDGDSDDTHLKDLSDRKKAKGYRYYNAIKQSYGGANMGLKQFLQAYLASISAVDANISTVMTALDNSPYKDNTIVILASDHGWQMGEKEWLFKGSPWEESTRIPMVIRVPGMTKPGSRCGHPVSLVDLYPTLVDLCQLTGDTTKTPKGRKLDGHSVKPFLQDPANGKWTGPDVALTLVRAAGSKPDDESTKHYTVRSKRYRYIRYNNGKEELYDHETDPYEWTNLATEPKHQETRKRHLKSLNTLTGFDFPLK